jgi:hypothetical protein
MRARHAQTGVAHSTGMLRSRACAGTSLVSAPGGEPHSLRMQEASHAGACGKAPKLTSRVLLLCRPWQREVINATLQGRDVLCLMPTGLTSPRAFAQHVAAKHGIGSL